MNRNENTIIEYARSHGRFTKHEVSAHIADNESPITDSNLSWVLNVLAQKGLLARIGRGVYTATTDKNTFVPHPSEKILAVYSRLNKSFPYARFCFYEGEMIAPMLHHLAPNAITYIETDREAMDTVFNLLKDDGDIVYLKPTKEMVYHYIDMSKPTFFIKPLITESPLLRVRNIPMPTLEKILIDIRKDPDFFYLQGAESDYILENAFNLYNINESRLLRYASRRGIKEEIISQIKQK